MELLLIFVSTAIGTVVGVAAAIIWMNRRRTTKVGDAALRTQLQNSEWALTSASRDIEDLRKQLGEREAARGDLDRAQQQLAELLADKEKQTAQLAAAEQRAAESAAEVSALRDRILGGEEMALRVAALEAALASAEERSSAEIGRAHV